MSSDILDLEKSDTITHFLMLIWVPKNIRKIFVVFETWKIN